MLLAGRLEKLVEEVVQADAVRDDEIGAGELFRIVGLGLVVLGADTRRDDRADRDAIAAEVADDVGVATTDRAAPPEGCGFVLPPQADTIVAIAQMSATLRPSLARRRGPIGWSLIGIVRP